MMRLHARRRTTAATGFVAGITAALLMFAPAAGAQVTPPPSVVPIGGATGSTISGVTINGNTTTVASVAPSSTVAMQATLTLGAGVDPGWIYWAGYGWVGAANPSGCSAGVIGVGDSTTTSFNLTAPSTAGIYEVGAALAPDPCPWASPVPGPTIATIVVVSYDSLCVLAQSYSSDPAVADGLCAKLGAASRADARGQVSVKANVLRAFTNQVTAQTGKALTAEEAETLLTLASYL